MRASRTLLTAAIALACSLSAAQGVDFLPQAPMPQFVYDSILVKFKGGSAPTAMPLGTTVKHTHRQIGVSMVTIPDGLTVGDAIRMFEKRDDVVYAEPNYIRTAQMIPNDPLFASMYGPQLIKAPQGWDLMQGSPSVIIAIIDTGTMKTHEDLAAKLVPGFDFINNDADADDDHGHGTHTAGTAGAITNNSLGVAGIAPNCRIMPIKVLSAGGGGTDDTVMSGILFGADNGAKVLSMSLGGGGGSQALQDSLVYALGKGALPIAAAGNNGVTDMFYPAAFPECVAVAAVDSNDQRASFSNYGNWWVDVAAPGVNILSSTLGGGYGGSSGTSMACPHVAGLAGLLFSAMPGASPAAVRAQMENNCDFVGNFVAKGRINVFKAAPSIPVDGSPTSISVYEGTFVSGALADVTTSNNRYYSVNSKPVNRVGHVASVQSSYTFNKTRTLRSLSTKIEARGVSRVTVNGYAWNWNTSTYDYMGAGALGTSDTTVTLNFPGTGSAYRSPATGQVKVIYRAINPTNTVSTGVPFTFKVDYLKTTASFAN